MTASRIIGVILALLASALIFGEWMLPEMIAGAIPGIPVNSAFALLLTAVGLAARGRARVIAGCAVAALGAAALLQTAGGFHPADGYWRLLLNTEPPADSVRHWPGRMAIAAAASFLATGLLLAASHRQWGTAGSVLLQVTGGMALAIPLVGLYGYLLGMPPLYTDDISPVFMFWPTAVCLILAWTGLWLDCRRSPWFTAFYLGREDRQIFAAAIAVVLLVAMAAAMDDAWFAIASFFARLVPGDAGSVPMTMFKPGELHLAHHERGWQVIAVMLALGLAGALILWRFVQPVARRLHRQEKLLENVLEMIPEGVWIADQAGRITMGNPAAHAIWEGARYVGTEHFGQYKAWHHDTGEPVLPQQWGLARAIRHGETSLREVLDIECFDGTRKTILNSALPLRDSSGAIIGAIALNQDITEDMRMLDSLRRWEKIFQHAGWGIVIGSADGSTLELMNDEFARMHGYRVEELTGKPIAEAFAPEAWAEASAQIAKAHAHGRNAFESLHRRRDGSVFPVSVDVATVYDEQRRVRYRVVNVQDITERKRIESERLQMAEMQAAILDALPANVALIDGDGTILAINHDWTGCTGKHAGTNPERLAIGANYLAALADFCAGDPGDLAAAEAGIRGVIGSGRVRYSSEYCCGSDYCRHWFQLTAVPFSYGQRTGAIVMRTDITGLKNAERALRESEANLARAQAQAHLGSWHLDVAGNVLVWSEETYRIFGMAQGGSVDYAGFLMRVHPDDRERVDRAWRAAMQGERYDLQHRIVVDGRVKWVRERAELEFSREGRFLEAIGTVQDITELKEIEQYLESSRAELRQLAARREIAREEERKHIAREIHDELGQLLTALRMEISMLRLQFAASTPQLAEKLQDAKSLVDRTLQVVRDVASSLRPSALDTGICSALEWMAEEFARHSGIRCQLDVKEDEIRLDETRATAIFRIVQESLTNVARHAGAKCVWVSLRNQGERYVLEVRDDGKGYDPRVVREKKSYGLAGMRERAIALGGEFSISSGPGQGTALRVSIPLHAAGATT